jgi:transcriptional regulator with XRE-family HTH domain
MARLVKEWSREHLAELCGLTVEGIDAIENGTSDEGRARVLRAMGLDEVYLLTPQAATEFLEMATPLMMRLDEDLLQLALAEMHVVLRRAVVAESDRERQRDR